MSCYLGSHDRGSWGSVPGTGHFLPSKPAAFLATSGVRPPERGVLFASSYMLWCPWLVMVMGTLCSTSCFLTWMGELQTCPTEAENDFGDGAPARAHFRLSLDTWQCFRSWSEAAQGLLGPQAAFVYQILALHDTIASSLHHCPRVPFLLSLVSQ